MKKVLLLLSFISLILSGCTKYSIQIFDTLPKEGFSDIKLKNDYYEYESDTLKILYEFWTTRGVMAFQSLTRRTNPSILTGKNHHSSITAKSLTIGMMSKLRYLWGHLIRQAITTMDL